MTEEAIKQTETYQKLLQISRSNNEKATQDKSKYKAQIHGLQGEVKARTEAEASALKEAEAATAASAAAGAAHTNDMSIVHLLLSFLPSELSVNGVDTEANAVHAYKCGVGGWVRVCVCVCV
jgi:hypothetical protein